MRTRDNQRPHFVEVRGGHRFRKGQLASEHGRDTDLVRFDVDIGGNNRASGVVDTLALIKPSDTSGVGATVSEKAHHHVLPEKAFLLLQKLFHSGRRKLTLSDGLRVLAAVNVAVDIDLQLYQRVEERLQSPSPL